MTPVLLSAACTYFVAHVLRALRFWLLLGDTQVSISRTTRRFYLLSIAGLFVPLVVMEPCKIAGLFGLCRSRVQTVVAYAVARTLDLFGIGLLLAAAYSFSPRARPWVTQQVPWLTFLGLCAAGALFLCVLASARTTVLPLQAYLLRRHHDGVGIWLLRLLCRGAQSCEVLTQGRAHLLLTPLLFTLLAWMLDIFALHLLLPQVELTQLAPTWMGDSVTTLLSMAPPSSSHRGLVARRLFYSQAVLAATLGALRLASVQGRRVTQALRERRLGATRPRLRAVG